MEKYNRQTVYKCKADQLPSIMALLWVALVLVLTPPARVLVRLHQCQNWVSDCGSARDPTFYPLAS
jgi:hypothetical protein